MNLSQLASVLNATTFHMNSLILYYILILNNVGILVVTKSNKEEELLRNCTHVKVKASISSATEATGDGVVELQFLPDSHPYTVCFPSASYKSYRESAMLSHVACRQLGYMTYESRYHQGFISGQEPRSMLANMECHGHEQELEQCEWKELELQHCPYVMAVTCTSCFHFIEASEGLIMNPGHPHAYFYTIYCEWLVTVPEGHTISFTFLTFFLPPGIRGSSLLCDESVPYVEISYADINVIISKKYCSFNRMKMVKVDHRRAKVRFFSGIYRKELENEEKKYGFKMMFQARASDPPSTQPYKVVLITSAFLLLFIIAMSCYCCRKWESRAPRPVRSRRATSIPSHSLQQPPTHPQHPLGMKSDGEGRIPAQTLSQMDHSSSFLSFSTPPQHSSPPTLLRPRKEGITPKGDKFRKIATPYSTPQVMPVSAVEDSEKQRKMLDSWMISPSSQDASLKDCLNSANELPSLPQRESCEADPTHYSTFSMTSTEDSQKSVKRVSPNFFYPDSRIRARRRSEGSGCSMHPDEEQSRPPKTFRRVPDVVVECVDDAIHPSH